MIRHAGLSSWLYVWYVPSTARTLTVASSPTSTSRPARQPVIGKARAAPPWSSRVRLRMVKVSWRRQPTVRATARDALRTETRRLRQAKRGEATLAPDGSETAVRQRRHPLFEAAAHRQRRDRSQAAVNLDASTSTGADRGRTEQVPVTRPSAQHPRHALRLAAHLSAAGHDRRKSMGLGRKCS